MSEDVVLLPTNNHSDSLHMAAINNSVPGDTSGLYGATSGVPVGTSGGSAAEHVWSDEVREKVIVVTFIMVCTLVGNTTLLFVILCKRSRRIKRVNVFLVNLAIGDIAVAFFMNTTEILFLAFDDWALGPVMCKVSVYLQIVTLASATFLLTAMSIDRYQVIVKPLHSLAHRPKILIKVGVAWIMAFVFATPQLAIFVQVEQGLKYDGTPKRLCLSRGYTAEWQRKVYFTFLTTYILLVPSIVMVYCYSKIIRVVWSLSAEDEISPAAISGSKSYQVETTSSRMSVRRVHVTACKRRVVIMTLTVIAGFLVCNGPYFVVTLIRIYSDYKLKLRVAQVVSENIVLTHSALNPLLYGIFTLRLKHFTSLLNCIKCGHRSIQRHRGKRHQVNGGECRKLGKGRVIQLKYNSNRNPFMENDEEKSKSVHYRELNTLTKLGKKSADVTYDGYIDKVDLSTVLCNVNVERTPPGDTAICVPKQNCQLGECLRVL